MARMRLRPRQGKLCAKLITTKAMARALLQFIGSARSTKRRRNARAIKAVCHNETKGRPVRYHTSEQPNCEVDVFGELDAAVTTLIKLIVFGVAIVFLPLFFLRSGHSLRSTVLHNKKETAVGIARVDKMKQGMFRFLDVAQANLASLHIREIPRCRGKRHCAHTTEK
jgi:hypothetical protein